MHVRMLSLQQLLACDHSIGIAMPCFDMFRSVEGGWRLLEVVAAKADQAGCRSWTMDVAGAICFRLRAHLDETQQRIRLREF